MLRNLSAKDSGDFEGYLAANATIEGTVLGPPYGPIDIYRLRR